jgi:hypothetical protein
MPTVLQFRRGTTAQNNSFTGAAGELSVDTDLDIIRVHDGSQPGGFALVGTASSQTLTNKSYEGSTLSVTGNVTGGNLITAGLISATGNITGNFFLGNGSQLTGIDATSIQNGTSSVAVINENGNIRTNVAGTTIATVSSSGLLVTGSIEATNGFIGLDATAIANGTANVRTFANANVTVSAAGIANVLVVTGTGGNIAGTLNATGNANVGNLGAATVVATTLTGTLSTAAQTNITSVGTLTSLTVTGNSSGGNLNTAGQVVVTGTGAATSTTTGSIRTAGGLGVAGNAYVGGIAVVTGNISGGNVSGTNLTGTLLTAAQTNITSVGTLTSLSVTGNISGGNVSGTNLTGTLLTAAQTNITSVGTLSTLTVTGNVTGGNLITAGLVSLASITKSGSNGVGNIGQSNNTFNTVFAKATSAQYADLAELYTADATYKSGTVLVFGGAAEVTESTESHSVRIAGVVSTNPAHVMNSSLTAEHTAVMALVGRVPCRVVGTIAKGDCLVSSDLPGVATTLDAVKYQPGAVIGKALENYNSTEPGIIEVVVGRL